MLCRPSFYAIVLAAAAWLCSADALEAAGSGAHSHRLPPAVGQPPTRGADLQDCATISLPKMLQLAPRYPGRLAPEDRGFFTISGAWQTADQAGIITWVQDLLGWTRRPTLFYNVGKLAFKSVPLESATRVASDPGPVSADPETFLPFQDADNWDIVFLRDCNNVLQYTIRVSKTNPDKYEVYNRDAEKLTESHTLQHVADQMFFEDPYGKPIAYAQSPAIMGQVADDLPDNDWTLDPVAHSSLRHGQEAGMVQPWEMKFIDDGPGNSSLIAPQNRWVLAAVVQERAIRMAGSQRELAPWGGIIFTSFVVLVLFIIVAMVYGICRSLFQLVYPPPKAAVRNPFLHKDVEYLHSQAPFAEGAANMADYASVVI
eukprot:TRINITY_DN80101_c0_g1_i1.p1 TRINITY_DN80101_c0_g1~~TRINITY_DN80101_c0_g1_i1.p1  ORF type:complete len:372 (-),score=73.16 TRINITY_DN80101_c0_g1_i1:134-1249(-)